jgi:hypothetical protein
MPCWFHLLNKLHFTFSTVEGTPGLRILVNCPNLSPLPIENHLLLLEEENVRDF